MNLSKLLSFEQGRITFFETLTKHPENWQQNPTPLSIVRKMLDKTPLEDKKILVLFNIEFLQVLVEERKINPENIYYIADNELEYLSAIKIFKVQSYKLSDFSVPALKKLIAGSDMKFDVVFSNPPYNKNIDIKILNEIFDIADEFIIVHPSGWLIDLKDKSVLYRTFKQKIEGNLRSVELFNGNPIFNIRIFMPCSITHIDKKLEAEIEVVNFSDTYYTKSVFDINKFGSKWSLLIMPFVDKISKYSQENDGNLWQKFSENKLVSFKSQDGYLIQLPMGRGDEDKVSHSVMVKDNFYAVFSNNQNEIETKNKSQEVYFSRGTYCYFNTEQERENCINYLKTDFARFCLSIYKIRKDYDAGELELIPWLDFTEEWDDDKLFAKFDVSQELQDYIRDFLPDYYGIRK
jgi:hypothetical protein